MVATYPLEEGVFEQIVRDGHGAIVISSNGGHVPDRPGERDGEKHEARLKVKHLMWSPKRLLPKGRPLRNVPHQSPPTRAAIAVGQRGRLGIAHRRRCLTRPSSKSKKSNEVNSSQRD